jgi:predicted ATPase
MEDGPDGEVTFVFTDIEGSTRLLHDLGEDAYAATLAVHHGLIRQAFRTAGGVEIDNAGDGFLFVFQHAPDAVRAAEQAQTALHGQPVRVRMGVHSGSARMTAQGYVGLDLHKGARIGAAAHGGQILISESTRELVVAGTVDLGEHRLKDFNEPVRLFQIGSARFPPLRTISNTNLPRAVSSFIGRQDEVAAVVSLVREGARLVTLVGPGGAGKTRLALESAAELIQDNRDGLFWVALEALRQPALVLDAVRATLGVDADLASYLRDREVMLLLDNFEQVVEAARDLADLLRACPGLRVLVTSREVLAIDGEIQYPVPLLSRSEAIELFCARARVAADESVPELCARLDDLPLAIELAAARTSVLSPAQILERMSDRLDLLRGGRDVDTRQHTLRATIAWSYDLLTPEERMLFARLSIFTGGCSLEAASEVCDASLDGLQSLVDKSLLQHRDGRFSMLETIREYASSRLDARHETSELVHRHGERLIAAAKAFDREREAGRTGSVEMLDLELANIRATIAAALEWPADPLALRLASELGWFWSASGRQAEGLRWTTEALERCDHLPGDDRAYGLGTAAAFATFDHDHDRAWGFALEALALRRAAGDEAGVADAMRWLAVAAAGAGDFEQARQLLAESIELQEGHENPVRLARTLNSLAYVQLESGHPDGARALLARALDLARGANAAGLAADVQHSLGDVALGSRHAKEAAALYAEALAATPEDTLHAIHCLGGIAASAALEGDDERAGRLWGAIQTHLEEIDVPLDTSTLSRYAELLNALEGAHYTTALITGRKLSLQQAVHEILDRSAPRADRHPARGA